MFSHSGRTVRRGSQMNRRRRQAVAVLLLGQTLSCTGCDGAPSVTIAGAYFPAWLLCAIVAVLMAALIRVIMVATGLAKHIPYQLAVCCSAGIIVALIVWHVWVVH